MHSRNIIIGFFLLLLGLSSCSNEALVNEQDNLSTTSVQFILSSTPTITKAGTGDIIHATDQELEIQNCVLGIYDETTKEWFGTTFVESLTANGSQKGSYTVASNLKLTNDHTYTVMVIANVDETNRSAYEACESLEAFEAITEGDEELYAFNPSKLLKYGKKTVTISPTNNTIAVPLDILAARIDLVINVKQSEDVKFEETYYEMGVVDSEGKPLDFEKGKYTATEIIAAFGEDAIWFENWGHVPGGQPANNTFYYGNRPIETPKNGTKGVYIPDHKAVRVDRYIGKTIIIESLTIENIRTQAIAVLPIEETSMHNLDHQVQLNLETRKYSFYTYAKEKETTDPLRVFFNGTVKQVDILKKTPVTTAWFAFADNTIPRVWGSTGDASIIVKPGWGNSSHVYFAMKKGGWEEDPYELPDETTIGKEFGPYDNSFTIKGEESGMIEYGHFYDVTATIVDFTPQIIGTLDVSIQDYTTKEVSFEFD